MGAGRPQEAEKELRSRKALAPGDLETLQLLFALHWQAERFGEAQGICDDIIKINPTLEYAFACKAMCLYALGRWEEAIESLRKVDEDEGSSDKYFLKGMCYYKLGRLPEAAADLQEMLARGMENQPRMVQALFALGDIYHRNNDRAKASEYFGQAWKVQPAQALGYLSGVKSLIRFYHDTGDSEAAKILYTEAASVHSARDLEHERALLGLPSTE